MLLIFTIIIPTRQSIFRLTTRMAPAQLNSLLDIWMLETIGGGLLTISFLQESQNQFLLKTLIASIWEDLNQILNLEEMVQIGRPLHQLVG